MIVKVQVSKSTMKEGEQALVYDKDRTAVWEGPIPRNLKQLMGGRSVAYFNANIIDDKIDIRTLILDQTFDW